MEDFNVMVSVRFPELKKFIQNVLQNFLPSLHLRKNYENDEDNMELEINLLWIMLKYGEKCIEQEEIPISEFPTPAFTKMFFFIIKKYIKEKGISVDRSINYISESFVFLFETLVQQGKFTPEYCIKFLADLKDAWPQIDDFYSVLSESNVKLILDCFVKQRSLIWCVRDNLLTYWLSDEERHHFCEKLFIRYGFKYIFDNDYFRELCDVFMEGMRVDDVLVCFFLYQGMLFETEDILRMQQAIELLVALFIKEVNRNAISLLWKALPHAFITANELYNLLKPCIFERYDLLQSLCDQYEKTVNTICPVPKVPEPRSLKHLSRVQVRNRLFQVNNLNEETIGELDIPVTLKDYLWLDGF